MTSLMITSTIQPHASGNNNNFGTQTRIDIITVVQKQHNR